MGAAVVTLIGAVGLICGTALIITGHPYMALVVLGVGLLTGLLAAAVVEMPRRRDSAPEANGQRRSMRHGLGGL